VSDTSGDDTTTSESGGTMTRLSGTASPRDVDLELLEGERTVGSGEDWRPDGTGPFLAHGDVLLWRYGKRLEPMRVVRDDEQGLVAWLAEGTELIAWTPADGRSVREVPLAERFLVEGTTALTRWQGGGVLRVAPTGRPWSVWLFWEDDGSFAGHYVNLELPHRRRGNETATRDLTLDLWLEPSGELWLKDADELEMSVETGRYARELADEVHAAAEWARAELVEGRDWPLDEEWTAWRPPEGWTAQSLQDDEDVRAARSRTLPS
jgi:predicted RNA-binding protein associated with RNAse of E/G family